MHWMLGALTAIEKTVQCRRDCNRQYGLEADKKQKSYEPNRGTPGCDGRAMAQGVTDCGSIANLDQRSTSLLAPKLMIRWLAANTNSTRICQRGISLAPFLTEITFGVAIKTRSDTKSLVLTPESEHQRPQLKGLLASTHWLRNSTSNVSTSLQNHSFNSDNTCSRGEEERKKKAYRS